MIKNKDEIGNWLYMCSLCVVCTDTVVPRIFELGWIGWLMSSKDPPTFISPLHWSFMGMTSSLLWLIPWMLGILTQVFKFTNPAFYQA